MATAILILDFGSQTTHLIGRRLQDMGVDAKIVDPEMALQEIAKLKPKGLILSGGPSSVYLKNAPTVDKKIFSLGIPVLGICYGWQLIAHLLAGEVVNGKKEYGPQILNHINGKLFIGLPKTSTVWVSHGDTVIKLPPNFISLASTEKVKHAAAADLKRKIYGVQFHPELEHTEFGQQILQNFLKNICYHVSEHSNKVDLKPKTEEIISRIKKQVEYHKAICAVSGGVDSTVSAFLAAKAIGKNLIPVYVNSGLMRMGTDEEVKNIFKPLGIKPIVIKAKKLFLKKLYNVTDYRKKRKIIGNLYIKLFEKEALRLASLAGDKPQFLVQGTLYSDVIESQGTKYSSNIRFHHNVSGLPKNMKLTLIEPLREFYKDQVREIGRILKLPKEVISKQPFPGPGQAIRIIGKITSLRLKRQQLADSILLEEIKKAGFYEKVFQSFTVCTGAKSTGVKGDLRFFGEVIALRIYDSKDIMSAGWSKLPYELLQKISSRIVNEIDGVSRVVYDITTKPPATMEWE